MLKRGTLLLLVSAIALLGGVLLFEGNRAVTGEDTAQTGDNALTTSDQQGELMFPFAEEDVASLTVERPADTLSFEKAEDGTWQMIAPETRRAEPGAIAFLLTQLTNPSANTLSVPAGSLADFGLDNPTATVALTANGNPYQLTVGTSDFTGDQLYVQATDLEAEDTDTSDTASDVTIHLVSGGLDNAINRPTPDWLEAPEPTAESESAPDEARDSSE